MEEAKEAGRETSQQELLQSSQSSAQAGPRVRRRDKMKIRLTKLLTFANVKRKRESQAAGLPSGFGRVVHINEPARRYKPPQEEGPPPDRHVYCSNAVSSTKYNVFTFIPKALYEQFRRAANFFFLSCAIIGLTPLSPYKAAALIVPLVFVITVSMIKEAIEDSRRHAADLEINRRKVLVYEPTVLQFVEKQWQEVEVGDVLKILKDEYFPADLLFLSSSFPDGVCYVETMNLDGETNLKLRKSLDRTCEYATDESVGSEFQDGVIKCEDPNASLYTFVGNLDWKGETTALEAQQVLLRGSKLRNTAYVYGCAIFTGHDSKVMMNSSAVPSKRSKIEQRMDKIVFILFSLIFTMSVVGSITFGVLLGNYGPSWWYLQTTVSSSQDPNIVFYDSNNPGLAAVCQALTALVLYNFLIPISLYVSIEIVKVCQALFINADKGMYYEELGKWARARTSNLNEELGQVDTILSDKTGTLTCNQMEFLKCSIAGTSYGRGITEVERATATRMGIPLSELPDYDPEEEVWTPSKGEDSQKKKPKVKGFALNDSRLLQGHWMLEPNAAEIQMFLHHLSLCHTVIPDEDEATGAVTYEAESPDEAALVETARQLGFEFCTRTQTTVYVREPNFQAGALKSLEDLASVPRVEREYEILEVIEFNSTRKRMSVVVQFPDGRIFLFIKGADSVIYSRLSADGKKFAVETQAHLNRFGEAGLRTLALAYKEIPSEEYEKWASEYNAARTSLEADREEKLEAAAEHIESGLTLLGATAVEDKLQAGVPHTIDKLAQAGIKIWVLTGDKLETAINIGFACSLLRDDMKQIVVSLDTPEIRAVEDSGDLAQLAAMAYQCVDRQIEEGARTVQAALQKQGLPARTGQVANSSPDNGDDDEASVFALIIDGKSLIYALDLKLQPKLLALAIQCSSVICCRVSPKQKALVTRLVKDGTGKTTLGIGDGANDVGMIQEADIGVGISGVEGQQAVMASDFAIAQFKYLERLLLMHGHWCYKRISCMVTYFFFKNITMGITLFLYNAYTGFSGQVLYNSWAAASYNVFFTALPVISYGVMEQDVPAKACFMFPGLYQQGPQNKFFNWPYIIRWLVNGIYIAVSLFAATLRALSPQANFSNGFLLEMPGIGATLLSGVVIAVNLQMALMTDHFTWMSHLFIWGSIAVWYLFIIIISSMNPSFSTNWYELFFEVVAPNPSFWLVGSLLLPIIGVLPFFLFKAFQTRFCPLDNHIINKLIREKKDEEAAAQSVALMQAPVGFSAAIEAVSKRLLKQRRKHLKEEKKRRAKR